MAFVFAFCTIFIGVWATSLISLFLAHRGLDMRHFYLWPGFFHSLFDAVPLGLLIAALVKSPSAVDGGEPAIGRLKSRLMQASGWLRRHWFGRVVGMAVLGILLSLVVVLLVFYGTIASLEENSHSHGVAVGGTLSWINEDSSFRLIGTVPYLSFLAVGIWLCLRGRRNPPADTLAATTIVLALLSCLGQLWIAEHLGFSVAEDILILAVTPFNAASLGLLLWAVCIANPLIDAEGAASFPQALTKQSTLPATAALGWGLLAGFVALSVTVGVFVTCFLLHEFLIGGRSGPPNWMMTLALVAIPTNPAIVALLGTVIAARRARRRIEFHQAGLIE